MAPRFGRRSARPGFTLIELLVVMAIIAILATIGMPALRGFGRSAGIDAGTRQLLDDLSFARLKALSSRTTVYMVFVPTNILEMIRQVPGTPAYDATRRQLTNLFGAQYSGYALVTKRTVGDQPGRNRPQYVTEWKRLPEGVVIPPYKFSALLPYNSPNLYTNRFEYRPGLPFPATDLTLFTNFALPYLAFTSQGQLASGRDEVIPLGRGSLMVNRNSQGMPVSVDLEVRPRDNFTNNYIRVNWLTGRASVQGPVMR